METRVAFVVKLGPNTNTTPRRAFLNAEHPYKRNKKISKICNEKVQNLQHFEIRNTSEGVI
jgi:hypothetical protein